MPIEIRELHIKVTVREAGTQARAEDPWPVAPEDGAAASPEPPAEPQILAAVAGEVPELATFDGGFMPGGGFDLL